MVKGPGESVLKMREWKQNNEYKKSFVRDDEHRRMYGAGRLEKENRRTCN